MHLVNLIINFLPRKYWVLVDNFIRKKDKRYELPRVLYNPSIHVPKEIACAIVTFDI